MSSNVIRINTITDAENLFDTGLIVFGYGSPKSPLMKTFSKTANKLRQEYNFAHSNAEEVLAKYVKEGVVLYRPKHLANKFEDSSVMYNGAVDDEDAMASFIADNRHGIVGHRTTDNTKDFKEPIVIGYYNVDYVKDVRGTNVWRDKILKIAKDFPGYNFAVASKNDFKHELTEFGLDFVTGDKPVITAKEKGLKYKMAAEFDMDNFKEFMEDLKAGNLDAYIKSEAVPDNSLNNVKIAVAKNFDELITKNKKDVLVLFYAPWCGHCKKFTPIYDELGEKMINEDIEIVKINITANDIPETFSIPRYPTVYWVPSSTKLPILYSGKMDLETLIRFILKMKGRGEKAGLLHEIKVDVHSPGDSVETQVNSVADKINFFEVNIIFFSFCFFISINLIFSSFSQFFILLLQVKYFCYN